MCVIASARADGSLVSVKQRLHTIGSFPGLSVRLAPADFAVGARGMSHLQQRGGDGLYVRAGGGVAVEPEEQIQRPPADDDLVCVAGAQVVERLANIPTTRHPDWSV